MEPLHVYNEGFDKSGKVYDLLDTAIRLFFSCRLTTEFIGRIKQSWIIYALLLSFFFYYMHENILYMYVFLSIYIYLRISICIECTELDLGLI